MATQSAILQDDILLRIWQIIGHPKKGIQPLIPIGRTTFLNKVKSGLYPSPIRISERTVAWRSSDIKKLIDELGGTTGTSKAGDSIEKLPDLLHLNKG